MNPCPHPNSSPFATTAPPLLRNHARYDALGRVSGITDAGGGTATYTYSLTSSDVLVAVGPIPTGSGENLKQRQLEYNSLGWLTSVCEITSTLPGYGTCAQSTSTQPSGYWTKYSYDALGDLLTVTQNAQAASASQQTRAFAYDAMGRLTSKVNPEMNQTAISYTYDTIASGACAGTYSGDLVKRVDAIGNTTCYTYDQLHRPLSMVYTVSSPTVSTPNKCFVYDAAIDSQSVANTKARLAEAYTTTSACSQTTLPTTITDLAFGYSLRGEITDTYEKTPHSGGTGAPYNHTTASFWASGALNTLGGPVIPTLTYGLDPEGRTTNVSASGTNPVTSTTYNLYTNPPQQKVTFGSGDSDTFNLDANTFRLTQYQFKVGTQTVTGAVNWNPNGSLGSLNITDQFNSSNTQNCSYTADDLARINKGDCGTIWGQTFSYDAFGNISKTKIAGSGATSFNPTYQSSPSITNRVASVGGTNATYDANGNSLNDTFRSFTWDAENRPVTIGSVSLTYDALGRMVEQSVSGTNTEIVYTPLGGKLSLMNGTSLIKAFAPLTGGASAVYTSGTGPAYYRHTDHLGSSRFASIPSQTLYSDTAYSPFGEPYASSGTIDNSFTGQNQDTLAGLYDFMYREHDPNQGRWTQPDPAGLAAVDPSNPQSWNRYSYVLNNPLALIDPSGLVDCVDGHIGCNCDPLADDGCTNDIYGAQDWGLDGPCFLADFSLGCSNQDSALPKCPNGLGATLCIDIGGNVVGSYDGEVYCNGPYCSRWNGATYSWIPCPAFSMCMSSSAGVSSYSGRGGRGGGFTVAHTANFIIPIVYGVLGPAFTGTYVPSQNLVCGGFGGGASLGHSISVGPQLVDANNAEKILSGPSLSAGYNSTPFQGAQGSINFSGSTGGYSAGVPGGSVAVTFSWCGHF